MAYKPKVLTVPEGGSGGASHTAYAVLCGGTSSTGAIQSIAGVGSSGQWLTSNGASALPTFQAATTGAGGYWGYFGASAGNPADGQTYFFIGGAAFTTATASGLASTRIYIPVSGTLKIAYGAFSVIGTLGSNENCTLALRLNNTTDTNISTSIQLTSSTVSFNNTSMATSITAGDYLECKFISASWGTNPTSVSFSMSFIIQ